MLKGSNEVQEEVSDKASVAESKVVVQARPVAQEAAGVGDELKI
jgi:hypothetical protein